MDFTQKEISKKVKAGHVYVFPLSVVCDILNLCLSMVVVISQEGRCARLILDFTRSGPNNKTVWESPAKLMHFRGTLFYIIGRVLMYYMKLGTVK